MRSAVSKLGTVAVDDHRASAEFGDQVCVLSVGPQVREKNVLNAEALDRQLGAGDNPRVEGGRSRTASGRPRLQRDPASASPHTPSCTRR